MHKHLTPVSGKSLSALAEIRASEVVLIGLTADAQLLAEAAHLLSALLDCHATGCRLPLPPTEREIALPRRLRAHGGRERSLMTELANEIEGAWSALHMLPCAPSPQVTLSTSMRRYLLDAQHPGCETSFQALKNRGLLREARWGAPLTELGLAYVWSQLERRLDALLTPKQRGQLWIVMCPAEMRRLESGRSPFRAQAQGDHVEIVDVALGGKRVGMAHPFLSWKSRMDLPSEEDAIAYLSPDITPLAAVA